MNRALNGRVYAILVAALAVAVAAYWYQFAGRALDQAEVDTYMAKFQAQTDAGIVRHDLQALRQFLQDDDGLPFYTVNLYRFHGQAVYGDGSAHSGTGAEAYNRFSAVMVRLLAARASHPIFGSSWSDAFASSWDRVVIVRYRSRRDIADLFASDEFAGASEHKWAAIKQNERMVVQAVHLPNGLLVLGLLALIILVVTGAVAVNYPERRY